MMSADDGDDAMRVKKGATYAVTKVNNVRIVVTW